MKSKVGIIGASGRMGMEIIKSLELEKGLDPFLGIQRGNQSSLCQINQNHYEGNAISEVEVWIDFSLATNFDNVLSLVKRTQKPLVSGTTGLSEDQLKRLRELSQSIPVLWSSNMSLGINLVQRLIESLNAIQNFDFQIEETHHNKKLDRPSGTAVTLQKKLQSVLKKDIPAPLSIRGGGVYGDHKIMAFSDDEVISIEHRALNRTIFAKGAIVAAKWILNKSPGLYSMEDVLFL